MTNLRTAVDPAIAKLTENYCKLFDNAVVRTTHKYLGRHPSIEEIQENCTLSCGIKGDEGDWKSFLWGSEKIILFRIGIITQNNEILIKVTDFV